MPGAQTHDLLTVITAGLFAPGCFRFLVVSGVEPGPALGATLAYTTAHLLSGVMFSPDLDIDSAIDDRWGPLFWIWLPYMWLVPHRHRLFSHGLIISALIRLAYFLIVVLLLTAAVSIIGAYLGFALPTAGTVFERLRDWIRANQLVAGCIIAGFVTGGDVHVIADWLVTSGKGVLRYFGIKPRRSYRNHDRHFGRRRAWFS